MLNLADPLLLRKDAFVDGTWTGAGDGRRFKVSNPANGEVLKDVADLDVSDARIAIESAAAAFPAWSALTAKERAAVLRRWFDLVMAAKDDLAALITAEQGKPLAESRGEVSFGAAFIEWFAEEGKRLYGDLIPTHSANKRILVLKQPIGVVAAITPWNFPMAMITRKVAPALAAGCTVVVKPADETPLCALALAELAMRAGLPAGVLNIVPTTRARSVGLELTQNPLVRKLSFTGSTEVGKQLMTQCASTVKKVSLELGGNAPFIVFDDADLAAAIEGGLLSKYRNAGQVCVCTNRFFVQEGIYKLFQQKLSERVSQLKVGDGFDAGVTQGPLITMNAVEKIERLLADAVAGGARIELGGKRHELGGTFFEPTIMTGVRPEMAISREEIFGPVATLIPFKDETEVIRLANDTRFGLAAYFYARDLARVFRVAEALEYGMICVNDGVLSTEVAPFGGIKESGIGREGSKYGIEEYVEMKYVLLSGLGSSPAGSLAPSS